MNLHKLSLLLLLSSAPCMKAMETEGVPTAPTLADAVKESNITMSTVVRLLTPEAHQKLQETIATKAAQEEKAQALKQLQADLTDALDRRDNENGKKAHKESKRKFYKNELKKMYDEWLILKATAAALEHEAKENQLSDVKKASSSWWPFGSK